MYSLSYYRRWKTEVTFGNEIKLRGEERLVQLMMGTKPVGQFSIDGSLNSLCSLSIILENEVEQVWTRCLILEMIRHIESEARHELPYGEIPYEHLFFIDIDFSGGFWDHIGMKENRYGLDYHGNRDIVGKGYEKVITWRELNKYTLGS